MSLLINYVYDQNPNLKQADRLSTNTTDDNSNILDQKGELYTGSLDLSCQNERNGNACFFVSEHSYAEIDFGIINDDVSIMNPKGVKLMIDEHCKHII